MSPWFLASTALTILAWVGWLVVFLQPDFFPEKVPIHWNIRFEPDGWASGSSAGTWLIACPLLLTLMLALDVGIARLSQGAFESPGDRRQLDYVFFLLSGFFVTLMAVLTDAMVTTHIRSELFMGAFFALFALLGPAMRTVKRNGAVGVRTPWTLKDDVVWTKTHQLTARLWFWAGLIGLLLVLAGVPAWVPLTLVLAAGLYPALYSYLIYRQRSNHTTAV